MGGAVAIHTAALPEHQKLIDGVVVENTFTSVLEMIDYLLPIVRFIKYFVRNPWRSNEEVKKIKCPILMLSGAKDELVPPSMLVKLKEILEKEKQNDDVQLSLFADGDHLTTWMDPSYFSTIDVWINSRL